MSNRIPVTKSGLPLTKSIAVCALTAGLLAACGVSGKEAPVGHPVTAAPSADNTLTQAVTDVYQRFFDGSTTADQKIAALENGQAFADTIRAQADSPIAKGSKATVSSVTSADATHANVVYTISLNGTAALPDQSGTAVQADGTWKVSQASFCALLSLEMQGKPPAPCSAS